MNRAEYKLNGDNTFKIIIRGLIRVIIEVALAISIIGLGLATIILIPIAVARTFFNVSWIEMSVLGYVIPAKLSLLFPIICGVIGYGFWRLLDIFLEHMPKNVKSKM